MSVRYPSYCRQSKTFRGEIPAAANWGVRIAPSRGKSFSSNRASRLCRS
jgi:hypothetical protein